MLEGTVYKNDNARTKIKAACSGASGLDCRLWRTGRIRRVGSSRLMVSQRWRCVFSQERDFHSRNMKPPQTPTSTVASPYVRPKPRATAEDLLVPVGEEPPNPVNVFCPLAVVSAVLEAPAPPVVVDAMVLMVETFTLIGSCAPHG
jgi:hypothetical protein